LQLIKPSHECAMISLNRIVWSYCLNSTMLASGCQSTKMSSTNTADYIPKTVTTRQLHLISKLNNKSDPT